MAFVWIFYNQSASIMNIVQTRRTVTEKTSDSVVDNKAKNHVSRRLSAARRNESYFRPRPSCIQHSYIICRFRTFASFLVSLLPVPMHRSNVHTRCPVFIDPRKYLLNCTLFEGTCFSGDLEISKARQPKLDFCPLEDLCLETKYVSFEKVFRIV